MREVIFEDWKKRILEIVKKEKMIKITELAKRLNASLYSIEKYCDILELKGELISRREGRTRMLSVKK